MWTSICSVTWSKFPFFYSYSAWMLVGLYYLGEGGGEVRYQVYDEVGTGDSKDALYYTCCYRVLWYNSIYNSISMANGFSPNCTCINLLFWGKFSVILPRLASSLILLPHPPSAGITGVHCHTYIYFYPHIHRYTMKSYLYQFLCLTLLSIFPLWKALELILF